MNFGFMEFILIIAGMNKTIVSGECIDVLKALVVRFI